MQKPKTTVEKMADPEVRSLLKKIVQGVRAGMREGSSSDIADFVIADLTEASVRLPHTSHSKDPRRCTSPS